MPTVKKDNSVQVALITAASIVIVALIGYFGIVRQSKPDPVPFNYTVRVKDSKSLMPIVSAKVNVAEDQKAPQPYYTDSDGVVFLNTLSKDTKAISVEVTASGYQRQERNGLSLHTGSQDFLLEALPVPPVKQILELPMNTRSAETKSLVDEKIKPQVASNAQSNIQKEEAIVKDAQKDWRTKNFDMAIREYQEASKLNRNDYLPHRCLGYSYASHRDFDGAIREYELALHTPNAPSEVEAQVKLLNENLDALKAALARVRSSPDDAEANFELGMLLYYLRPVGAHDDGECSKAWGDLEKDKERQHQMYNGCWSEEMRTPVTGFNAEDCAGK